MCSSAGDIEDLVNFSTDPENVNSQKLLQKCKKCEADSTVILQKKDPFCNSCFLEYCDHKFRSTIGKSKKIKHGEKILLACSGGFRSSVLLHMTKQTLKSASPKQISFLPGILFIDERFLTTDMSNDSQPDVIDIVTELKKSNYDVLCSSLEMVYKINTEEELYSLISDDSLYDNFPSNSALKVKMNENLKNLTLSSKIDLLKHLRLLLIMEIANQANYDCVFIGDTASSLAVDLLSDIALGRGSQISSDTSFYDTRYKVPVCRPMRELLDEEIDLYRKFHGILTQSFPEFDSKTSFTSCIQHLTARFLSNLQDNFPATVFTVFRTGSKLSKNEISVDTRSCIICKSPLDNVNPDSCSAIEALKISEKISGNALVEVQECGPTVELMKFLCHGCSITFQHMSKSEDFHSLIPEVVSTKMKRSEMKDEIEEFLIEDDDS